MISSSPTLPYGHRPEASGIEPAGGIPTVEVATIIGSAREAVIVHKGERYRLRITANDKLILTK